MPTPVSTPQVPHRLRTPQASIARWEAARQAMLADQLLQRENQWDGRHSTRIVPYLRTLAACPLSAERLHQVVEDFTESPYAKLAWQALLRHPDRKERWNDILGMLQDALRNREGSQMFGRLALLLTPRRLASALRHDGVQWPDLPAAVAMAAKIRALPNHRRDRHARYLQQRLAYYLALAPGTTMGHRLTWARLTHLGGGVRGDLIAHPEFPKAEALQILWQAIDTSAITGLRRGAAKHADWLTDPDVLLAMSSGPRSLSTALLVLPNLPLAERHALFARAVRRLPGTAVGLLEKPKSRALLSPLPAAILTALLAHPSSRWFHERLYAILQEIEIDGARAAVVIPARFRRGPAAALAEAHLAKGHETPGETPGAATRARTR